MFDYIISYKRFFLFFYSLIEGWFLLKYIYARRSEEKQIQGVTAWAKKFTSRMGIKTRLNNFNPLVEQKGLVVSNHVSWFDGVILRGLFYTRYIAKSEVQHYPFIGGIAKKLNVIFISRENKAESPKRVEQVAKVLETGERVTLFPEGTTTDGTVILPFKVTFFESAIKAQVPIIPLVIRYVNTDNTINPEMGYLLDLTMVQSAWKIAKQRQVVLEVNVLEPIEFINLDRIQLADQARVMMLKKFEEQNLKS